MEFKTRIFYGSDAETHLDSWLNNLLVGGYSVMVVGYSATPKVQGEGGMMNNTLSVTVKRWKRSENPAVVMPTRTTIDEIPEEPSINYPEGGDEDLAHGN